MKNNFRNFGKDLKQTARAIDNAFKDRLPKAVSIILVDGFRKSWTLQRFNDYNSMPWRQVKRKIFGNEWYGFKQGAKQPVPKGARGNERPLKGITNFSRAATTRNILFGDGSNKLQESIFVYRASNGIVIIATDSDHAKIHNEGGLFRSFGKTRRMPQRQFMNIAPNKQSKLLQDNSVKKIEKIILTIIQNKR